MWLEPEPLAVLETQINTCDAALRSPGMAHGSTSKLDAINELAFRSVAKAIYAATPFKDAQTFMTLRLDALNHGRVEGNLEKTLETVFGL